MADEEKPPPYKRKPIGPFAIVSADIYANRKIRKAKNKGSQVFVFALTRNAVRGRTGSLDASELDRDYIADMLQIDVESAAEGLSLAVAANLLEIDGDTIHIVGWDETWARGAVTDSEARQLRRKNKTKTENQIQNQKETQTQKKSSPAKARTASGQGVWAPLSPPPAAPETKAAQEVLNTIAEYTGNGYSGAPERELIVSLMRKGHSKPHLQALAAYTCAPDGAGWWDRERDGQFYMRANCVPFRIFSDKQLREQLSIAVATVVAGELYNCDELTAALKAHEAERASKSKGAA